MCSKKCKVKGTHNKGSRVIIYLAEEKEKSIKVKEVKHVRYSKGIVVL